MKVRPTQDRVLVTRNIPEEKTKGGIIIPDTAKDKPMEGTVVAVGAGSYTESGDRRPVDLKAGDRVLFAKYTGSEIKVDGEDHLILRESDILAVVEG